MFFGCLLALVVGLARPDATCGEPATGAYADAVRSTGDVPVVIGGRARATELGEALGRIDLLLLLGGEDVAPARYGASPSPRLGKVDPARDEFEFRLLREAVRRELPIVGICRGVQVMNVFFGGTLWQDLPSERADATVCHRSGKADEPATHAIAVQSDTRLASAVGAGELRVNSIHHQAVRDLAPGFRVTARAADGVVEAIESDWYPAVGVQFHPERLCAAGDPVGKGFFRNLRALAGHRPTAPRAERPIGVFDSGIGGLSVLELLLTVDRVDNATGRPGADGKPDLSGEDFVYLGDQANMPYGRYDAAGKADFLRELVVRDAQFVLGGDRHPPAKIVVIACNTATAYGLDELRRRARPHDATVIGVVNAGVEAALDAMAGEKSPYAIAVMATPGTISSGVYERTIRAELKARNCPVPVEVANRGGVGLAEAVENREPGMADCARTNLVALVEGYRARGGKAPIRALILGCTHYPFVLDVFRSTLADLRKRPEYAPLLPADLRFVDPAVYTAEACYRALRRENLLRPAHAPRAAKRVQAFLSVGRNGPLPDAVKYGRDCGCHDLGTRIVPLTADVISADVAAGIGKAFPVCHRELGLQPKPDVKGTPVPEIASQWKGRKVAFLGDSITDKCHIGCTANYWTYLPRMLGLDAYVYGRNGWTMSGMLKQAEELKATLGDEVDAIFVFAGTNDFNGGRPLGEWFVENEEIVRKNADRVKLRHRAFNFGPDFRGDINRTMAYLKREFPRQQIVLLTPIHRAYAQFGEKNVQPDEAYANTRGLYIDAYVNAVKEAGAVWSVPVIDLYAESGLYPSEPVQAMYFHDARTDMLHPNAAGHRRIAATMAYRMLSLPACFSN